MYDSVFEKAKGRGEKKSRTSVYAEAAVQGFFKKDAMRNFAKFTRKHLCQSFLFGVFLSILQNL